MCMNVTAVTKGLEVAYCKNIKLNIYKEKGYLYTIETSMYIAHVLNIKSYLYKEKGYLYTIETSMYIAHVLNNKITLCF